MNRPVTPGRRGLLASLALLPGIARAADFPTRPLRVIVAYPPGGPTDVVMRLVAPGFEQAMGQPVVIENRGGAGGSVGAGVAARAVPDGYTILVNASSHAVNPSIYANLPYDPVRDFAPITLLATSPFVLVVHPSIPARTVPEFIEFVRGRPGTLTYASPGNGSANHLGMELLKSRTGTDLLHVPFAGGGPATTAVVAGQVLVTMAPVVVATSLIQSGQLRALALTGVQTLPTLPGLPTIAETLPSFDITTWYGALAPAGTPPEIVERLRAGMVAGLAAPGIEEKLLAQGALASPTTSEAFGRFVVEEVAKWREIARIANARLD
jgi:tripartite-type tricarboxylate transporter receptor subunit TctC